MFVRSRFKLLHIINKIKTDCAARLNHDNYEHAFLGRLYAFRVHIHTYTYTRTHCIALNLTLTLDSEA